MEKNIKFYFTESTEIINANRILFIVLAIALTKYTTEDSSTSKYIFSFISILFFLIMPMIYGRFIEIINGEQPTFLFKTYRKYLANYFVYAFFLMAPAILFVWIFSWILPRELIKTTFSVICLITSSLLLYVFPLIFLQKKQLVKFSLIVLGIKCLFVQLKYSLPLILLNILSYFIYLIPDKIYGGLFLLDKNILIFIVFRFLLSLLVTFINLSLFITAGMILIKEPFYKNYITTQSI